MTQLNRFDLPAVERARAEFAAAAHSLADGRAELLHGTRRLLHLGYTLGLDVGDPDFRTLVAFDSETDALPSGAERANWAPHALMEKDREIAAAEAHWGTEVRGASARLAVRFTPAI